MQSFKCAIEVISIFFVVPILAYMIMKFGTAGYLRARRREQQKQQDGKNDKT